MKATINLRMLFICLDANKFVFKFIRILYFSFVILA